VGKEDNKKRIESFTATQLGIFDEEVIRYAEINRLTDWPDHSRFPLNFDSRKVEQ